MKIAFVVHDFDPGFGQGRYAVELARRFAPDHDVHVYANRFASQLEANVTFQRVPALRRSALLTILSFIRNAETLLARRTYDIVHAQGVTCWHANVVTAHICNAARQRHESPRSLKARLFLAITSRLERRFYQANRQARVIGVSEGVSCQVQQEYGLAHQPAAIHHGIDCAQFQPRQDAGVRSAERAKLSIPEAAWVWLFVGEAAKGLSQTLRQLPAFPQARLLIVTRSDSRPQQRLADELGVASRVRFLGSTEHPERIYQLADVFVYPSTYDAFGMVVAEAMASGLPVICGRPIGAAEWIKDGENGLLCDPAQDDSLRQCLERLGTNAEPGSQLANAARQTALQHSWDECARATLAVYQQAIADRRNP